MSCRSGAFVSKYDKLWEYVKGKNEQSLTLSFSQITEICGFELDHSFLTFKKDLADYGYAVKKISMKGQFVLFEKI